MELLTIPFSLHTTVGKLHGSAAAPLQPPQVTPLSAEEALALLSRQQEARPLPALAAQLPAPCLDRAPLPAALTADGLLGAVVTAGAQEEAAPPPPPPPTHFAILRASPVGPQRDPSTNTLTLHLSDALAPLGEGKEDGSLATLARHISITPDPGCAATPSLGSGSSNPKALTLTFARCLRTATAFTVRVAAELRADNGAALEEPFTFSFETRRPALQSAALAQAMEGISCHATPRPSDAAPVAAISLAFDQPLLPSAALPRVLVLCLPRDGKDGSFEACRGLITTTVSGRQAAALCQLEALLRAGQLVDPATGRPSALTTLPAALELDAAAAQAPLEGQHSASGCAPDAPAKVTPLLLRLGCKPPLNSWVHALLLPVALLWTTATP